MSDTITDTVINAYLETLLWSETLTTEQDEEGNPAPSMTIDGEEYAEGTPLDQISGCDSSDMPEKIVDEAREDLESFRESCLQNIGIDPFRLFDASDVAHNFCLSRNGHGAGFFDREFKVTGKSINTESINIAQELQNCARESGPIGLMVWVDKESGDLKIESHG